MKKKEYKKYGRNSGLKYKNGITYKMILEMI